MSPWIIIIIAVVGPVFGFSLGLLVAAALGARRLGNLADEVERLRSRRKGPKFFSAILSPTRARSMFN